MTLSQNARRPVVVARPSRRSGPSLGAPLPLLLTKTVRDLRHRGLRSLLTLLGIVVGVAGVVAISYTARNLAAAQAAVYFDASQYDLAVSAREVSPTVRNVLERLDNVAVVEGRVYDFTRAAGDDRAARWVDLRLIGVADFGAMQVNRVELVEGRFPGPGEVALDAASRSLLPLRIGDTLYARHSSGERPVGLRVVGYTRTPASVDASILNQATAYAPIADARRTRGIAGDNRLLFRLADPKEAGATAAKVGRALGQRGVAVSAVRVRDPQTQEGRRELETLLLLLAVFSTVGAVLSGFLVGNTVAAIMAEEMRQVGIMKSLGAGRRRLVRAYLLPALVLGAAGTLLGLPAGIVGGDALGRYLGGKLSLELPAFSPSLREAALAAVVGLGVPVVAAVVPAWRGAGTPVSDLVRSYGIAGAYRRRAVDRLLAPLGRLSALALMALRNVGRRQARSAVTVLVIAIGAAVSLATQTLNASVFGTVEGLYGVYSADAYVSFGRPVAVGYGAALERLPDVLRAEAWSRAGGFVGPLAVDVWGLPPDSTLYRHRLLAGRWLRDASPREVVVSGRLAQQAGVELGQLLPVDLGQERRPFTVVGIVDDESTYLGSTASGKLFMSVADVSRLTYYGDNANFFALALRRTDPAGVDEALGRIELATRDYTPSTYASYSDKASTLQAVRILDLLLRAMVVLVGVIGAAGIANTLVLNVTERRRELGILRAVGAGSGHLLRLLLAEGLALGLLGLGLGVALGVPLAYRLVQLTGTSLFRLDFVLTPGILAVTALLSLGTALAASVGPGLLAARLRPIEALRYE